MRKSRLALFGISFLILVLGIFFAPLQGQQGDNNSSTDPSGNIPGVDPIKEKIKDMSIEEKVGQLVMVGVDGYELNANAQNFIQNYHVGGLVLLKKNVKDTQQMLNLINDLKETNKVNRTPLFLALDEEGGRISRMPAEINKMPSSQQIGEQKNENLAKRVGGILGQEIKGFGLNVNFAPVLDIFSNPKNTVIGDRAIGDNPDLVSKLGIQTMKGIQEQNIISVVKHFPGHGDTSVDSHVGLPRVDYDLERLMSFELVPFSHAIANNVDAVMLAHILLPKIDPDYPASFSEVIISDVLRKEMNYDGVVITDDMTMGAIVENYNLSEAAVKSIQAGSDIVLVCHDFAKEEAVLKAILEAAKTGKLSPARIDESVYRILKLKEKYSLTDQKVSSVNVQGINSKITELYKDYPALDK